MSTEEVNNDGSQEFQKTLAAVVSEGPSLVSSNELRPLNRTGESCGTKKESKVELSKKVDSLAKIQKFEVQIENNEAFSPQYTAMS